MTYEGVLPVYKPAGFTSHDVVAKVRRILGMKRIGHTGTLDPQVTGVLPLCLGRATRLVEYIQDLPKRYEAELTFGYSTDTEDWTGEPIVRLDPGQVSITESQLRRVLSSFLGSIEQIPPMYSAVKIGGKKLYELAREGKEVERAARKVHIYELDLIHDNLSAGYPTVRFTVLCSKGTYIRTLCTDIGKALGYPAVMSELVRSSSGSITLDRCLPLEEIERLHRSGGLQPFVIRPDEAVSHFQACTVPFREAVQAIQGKLIRVEAASPAPESGSLEGQPIRLYDPAGTFIGLFQVDERNESLRADKVFAQ